MDTNIHHNSLNGGGNNNVIIRIPSKNEHSNILLNSDLNGTIDIATSKLNVWNFISGIQDFTILQNNTMSTYTNILWHEVHGLATHNVSKAYISGVAPDYDRVSGFANFRPIFEFNQE